MTLRDKTQIKYAFIFFVVFFFCAWVNFGAAVAWVFGWIHGMAWQRDKSAVESQPTPQ